MSTFIGMSCLPAAYGCWPRLKKRAEYLTRRSSSGTRSRGPGVFTHTLTITELPNAPDFVSVAC